MKNGKNSFLGLIFLALIGLTSCGAIKEGEIIEAANIATPVEFTVVKSGQLHGAGGENIERGIVLVDSEASWKALKSKMNSSNQVIQDETVDFSTDMIIGYFDKVRGSGGYSVEIVSITETAQEIVVIYKPTSPSGDAIDIMTQPYTLVSIPQTMKGIRLQSIE